MGAFMDFLSDNGSQILLKTWEQLYISLIAVVLGIIVAIPLGIVLSRFPKVSGFVIGIVSVIQTFPSLAILAFFIPLLGVGKFPAIVALFIYSMLPILRNTYTGLKGVDKNLLEAGKGMGMKTLELIFSVELPLAVPVIMAGIRLSTVYLIGWATLASFVGAGGLGDFIFDGLNLFQPSLILAGAIPATILALIIDFILGKLEKWLTPKGLAKSNEETA
ncbi:osmoprotectant transport system permease protein [Pullulanibacillus pueri]|uniref:Glycine betaine/carnitine/choline transport system permease protein OpuCB n=1 Tax=Pullulanibacillus pueri TaxID=1437324 RepID=A0A8J3EMS7_9BACL|nr:ABC transporter permease [Pullulanibacillus pueri]MBM7683855.1 osmoprotectant transport system permease protein [Pullulanibacillus pueri]GGH84572.1 glycine betaine/carnitine/choline transport system permease protein OpuCB [Pullulanibacillus pueri]